MPLHYRASITRRDLWNAPATLFVFGDNLARHGFGGQASECRGEVNAVGVPTKRYPGRAPRDYFTDADYGTWHREAMPALAHLAEHLRSGGDVVWPAAGIGTGLAELSSRAPRIWACLERARERLDVLGATHAPPAPKVLSPTSHPLVRAVMAAWPGAQIVGVRDRIPAPVSPEGPEGDAGMTTP